MVLVAIAAVAATHLDDKKVLEAVECLARTLSGLPSAVSSPFDEATLADLRDRTGVDLPLDRYVDMG
jgi:hypothetical protein